MTKKTEFNDQLIKRIFQEIMENILLDDRVALRTGLHTLLHQGISL